MFQVDFHVSSMASSPKYTGKPKYTSTSLEKYEDDNNYTLQTIGLSGNNRTIQVVHSTYQNGRLSSEWADFDGDNKPDVIDVWDFDERENTETWKQDFDGDGLFDRVTKSKFDTHGNMIAYGVDYDMDGKADEVSYSEFQYDDNDNITYRAFDSDGDGIMDYREEIAYDEAGNCTQKLIDHGGRGMYDEQVSYKYNGAGGLMDEEHKYYLDNGSVLTQTLIYDGNGNLLAKTMK